MYVPLFLALGLVAGRDTFHVAQTGAAVLLFRGISGIGYASGGPKSALKKLGGLFHVPELYTLYLAATIGLRIAAA